MAISEDNLQTKHIPLPEYVDDFSSVSVINDTLVIGSRDADQGYCLDPKEWEWTPYVFHTDHNDTLFEDDDWSIKHSDHGEFGSITWFIDKHLEEEYAFGELSGNIHRIDSTLFIVSPTRVYALRDPSIGFHCDSTTTYESAKDVHLIGAHFFRAGYSPLEHNFLPVVHFDNEPAEIVERTFDDISYYDGGFYVSEFAEADTAIIGSFVASDTLFCALHTPSGLELVKLDNDRLSVVHSFYKDLGVYSRYSFYGHYPDVSFVSNYRDDSIPAEDKLLILINDKAGSSELFEGEPIPFHMLYMDHHFCVMNYQHPLADRKELSLFQILPYRLLMPDQTFPYSHMDLLIRKLEETGLPFRYGQGRSLDQVTIKLLESQSDLAVIPGFAVPVHPSLKAVPLKDGISIPTGVAGEAPPESIRRAFLDLASSVLGAQSESSV